MSGALDALDRLWRAVERSAAAAGLAVRLNAYSTQRWASATFEGGKHQILIDADPSEQLHAWARGLCPDLKVGGGHLVADLVVRGAQTVGAREHLTIDALTVEER